MAETNGNTPNRSFDTGRIVTTNGIFQAFSKTLGGIVFIIQCLTRHETGDWGDLDAHDWRMNDLAASDEAINHGHRLVSVYTVPTMLRSDDHPNDRIYLITANEGIDATTVARVTTILWPSEY